MVPCETGYKEMEGLVGIEELVVNTVILSVEVGTKVVLLHAPSGQMVPGFVREEYGNGLVDVEFRPHPAMSPTVVRSVKLYDHRPMMAHDEWAAWPEIADQGWRRAEDFVSIAASRQARAHLFDPR
jgi:hypothetical protein